MESQDRAIGRTCTLRENDDRISSIFKFLKSRQELINAVRDREILGIMNNRAINGIIPHPIICKENKFRMKRDNNREIEVRLMVANDQSGLGERLMRGVDERSLASRETLDEQTRYGLQHDMKA